MTTASLLPVRLHDWGTLGLNQVAKEMPCHWMCYWLASGCQPMKCLNLEGCDVIAKNHPHSLLIFQSDVDFSVHYGWMLLWGYHLTGRQHIDTVRVLVLVGVCCRLLETILDGVKQRGVLLHAHVVTGFTNLLLFKKLRYSHFKSHVSINTILAFVSLETYLLFSRSPL